MTSQFKQVIDGFERDCFRKFDLYKDFYAALSESNELMKTNRILELSIKKYRPEGDLFQMEITYSPYLKE